ncbi:hypothetical protein SAMN02745163_03667 [Clostridium cavendishii DSM 21758]|uniref:DUF7832 domain-containing protein n=1 Tax=Clostridium cavendishii DSM 21758 TaxID=1121302 RepID=A0A1M6RU16_9CLOT|nr:hypothetical protein [Clostridium cavendishii]SHK35777.1 hypothetical protein SAMN02745163_03667 [Clostridium cavendishii DSM 21758]
MLVIMGVNENGGTHIGMYLAWIILNNLEGEELHEGGEKELEFTLSYYLDNGEGYGEYINDYLEIFDNDAKETFYALENTWENYDKIAPIISKRYKQWKEYRRMDK